MKGKNLVKVEERMGVDGSFRVAISYNGFQWLEVYVDNSRKAKGNCNFIKKAYVDIGFTPVEEEDET